MSGPINAGLHEAALSSDKVRLVKARLLLSSNPEDVAAVKSYSGVHDMAFAALLLSATDGDVDRCKAEIDRFWRDRNYRGPLITDEDETQGGRSVRVRHDGHRAHLSDTL